MGDCLPQVEVRIQVSAHAPQLFLISIRAITSTPGHEWSNDDQGTLVSVYRHAGNRRDSSSLRYSLLTDPPTNGCQPLPFNRVPEVLNPTGTTLRLLSTAEEAANEAVWYPWAYLGSDGRVFRAGPLSPSRWLDTAGTGAWGTTTKPHVNAGTVPYRDFGSAVMYDVDKVLITGGGQNPPTNTAETIVLTNETGNWTSTNNMANARRHHNLTILADGKVLATGGTSGPRFQ